MAIGFHYVDYVVHGWDVARTLGQSYELPVDVVAAAVPLALVVPDGDFRTIDNAPFGPAIPSTDPADDLDRILAHLGRSPQWDHRRQAAVVAMTHASSAGVMDRSAADHARERHPQHGLAARTVRRHPVPSRREFHRLSSPIPTRIGNRSPHWA